MRRRLLASLIFVFVGWASSAVRAGESVAVLSLSDALDPDLLDAFTQTTGLPVTVDASSTPAGIETALRASKAAFDLLLVPAAMLGGLRDRLSPLGSLPEVAAIEPSLSASLADAGQLAVPFDWYPIGLAVNEARLRETGLDPRSGMALLVRSDLLRKAATCGVGIPDRPREVYGALATSGGLEIDRRRALALLSQLRPVARTGSDSELAGGLAQGDLCVALVPAPVAAGSIAAAQAADDGAALSFVVPDHATVAVDVLALPAGGRNPDGARTLMRFLLSPEHAAANARYGHVASALRGSPAVPDGVFNPALLASLVVTAPLDAALGRAVDAEWRRGGPR